MILVDSNEERCRVPDLLRRMNLSVTVQSLKVGDYLVGDVCVERKAISDYFGSKESGHLDTQLYEMSYNYDLSYLVIEGNLIETLMDRSFKRAPFYSSLVGSSFKRAPDGKMGQIVTLQTFSEYDTALVLRFLHDKVEKGDVRLPRLVKAKANPDELLVYILSSFPNVGEKRAKMLLSHFKTLRATFSSSDWRVDRGLGDKLNFKVQSLLDKEYEGDENESFSRKIQAEVI